jgi:hypothetical protein
MANILQAVQTYQASSLGMLQNLYAFLATCNKKFKDFNSLTANLGSTVTFDLPPRMVATPGLVVSTFHAAQQRVQSLTVDKSSKVDFAFTAEELIFNIDNNDYRRKFELSAMTELGAEIEADVAREIINSPYRFYGDGKTPINSYGQLASALAYFRNYGSANSNVRGYLDDIAVPTIINTGLSQFVINRNNETANSWELGRFSNCEWYQSNLLPTHDAGTVGNDGIVLTVVSISPDGTQLTVSGAGTDADAIKAGDLLQFSDNVSGQPNIRYRTFTGHKPSQNPVQVRATADAVSSADSMTINIFPALISTAGDINQNITVPIASGMELTALPSHRRGMICGGDAMFLGMPMLPDQAPFPTANKADEESGASIRFTQGSTFGQNQTGFIYDSIWGKTFVPEYCFALIFPQ